MYVYAWSFFRGVVVFMGGTRFQEYELPELFLAVRSTPLVYLACHNPSKKLLISSC